MPLNGIGSYVPTADEFLVHWTDVNADRIAATLPPVTLQGGYTLANFQTDRDALQSAITATVGLENARELAIGNRDSQKELLRDRLSQFRSGLELHLKQTAYLGAAPTAPQTTLAESKFLRPFDDMADLWGRINGDAGIPGFTPPLLLRAGYALAGFTADLAQMRTRYLTLTEAENDQTIGRRERDGLLPPLRERMNQYRSAIALEYPPGHAFLESLPDLSPAPGSTPDAVTASGAWNATSATAQLSWTASTNGNLQHYSVRVTPGPTFDTQNNTVVENVTSGQTTLDTTAGLENPGDVASYNVYVVLDTGNEAGSNTVTITRP